MVTDKRRRILLKLHRCSSDHHYKGQDNHY